MRPPPPCRLHVLFARDADVGVILRRGPSRWVQVIRWDTRYDTFEDGAWFHGRIYEDYCDVSPDGELFVYFAAKHNRVHKNDEYGYVWTAVSRPPWLFALALWPNPAGTWPGGGRFSDDRRLTVMTCGNDFEPHLRHPPPRGLIVDQRPWRAAQELPPPCIEVEGAQWSGRDQKDRIIFARDGKLFRRINGRDRELTDFNARVPEPRRAPAWAGDLSAAGGRSIEMKQSAPPRNACSFATRSHSPLPPGDVVQLCEGKKRRFAKRRESPFPPWEVVQLAKRGKSAGSWPTLPASVRMLAASATPCPF